MLSPPSPPLPTKPSPTLTLSNLPPPPPLPPPTLQVHELMPASPRVSGDTGDIGALAIHHCVIPLLQQCDCLHRCYCRCCSAVVLAPALAAYTLASSPSHGIIASPHLGNATSRRCRCCRHYCHCRHHRHCGHHHQGATQCVLICPTAQPKCRRAVRQLRRHQLCQPRTPSLCRHHTASSHRPTSATRPLTSLSLPPLSPLYHHRHCGKHHHCATQ